GRLVDVPATVAARRDEHALLLDALIASVALESVLGIVDPDMPFAIAEVIEAGAIAPDCAALLECHLRLLTRFSAASEEDGMWRVVGSNDLPDVAEVWRLLLAEAPELVAELALVAAAAEETPRLLAEGLRQAETSPLPMVEHLLHGSPVSAAGIDVISGALGEIAARWPQGRALRVLELGADGGATRRLLDQLAQSGVALAYRATNPDAEQAARLGSIVAAVAGASASCWSPRDPVDDLGDGRFDVIVSAHAGARLQLDEAALAQLRDLLAPGGLFIAVEPEPNPLWDVVFGRYAGWWQGADGAAEASPLRSGEAWRRDLAMARFVAPGAAALAAGPWPSAVLWGRAEPAIGAAAGQPAAARTISLIAAGAGGSAALREQLVQAGHRVSEIDAAAFAAQTTGEVGEAEGDTELAILVVEEGGEGVEQATRLIALLARIAAAAAQRHLPLWLVTTGAQQAVEGEEAGLVGAALWGFARVLVNEIPRLSLRLVDLAPGMDDAARADRLIEELAAATAETEIVWTAAGRCVLRLRRGLSPRWADAGDAIALTSGQQGGLDALGWQTATARPPGPGEVAIDVHAAGLNFRDMMWAMGLLPEEALIDGFAGPTFGLECAGIVREVGAGVEELAVGDRVAGFAPASLSTRVTTAAHAVTRIPPETSFAAAATIPVTFVTVIYTLGTLAKLMPGELVLIHAAAGGVGLAAIQYAKHRGAVVIATAGSEVKRAFLRLAGADYVLDSRDLGVANAVR
ncbi:MAG TPA: zinc-binding dehydrogenase, partial [Stellaceae bacterium]|nr:zinc-binding dehydrogenase [Stellaceae bacterium]